MGLRASLSYKAGEQRKTPSGRALASIHSETLWAFDIELPESTSLGPAIESATRLVAERRGYMRGLRARGARFEFFVGVFPDGAWTGVLTPEILKACSDEDVSLVLNIYGKSRAGQPL